MYTDEDLKPKRSIAWLIVAIVAVIPVAGALFLTDGESLIAEAQARIGLMPASLAERLVDDIEYNYYYTDAFETDAYQQAKATLLNRPVRTYRDFERYIQELTRAAGDEFSYFYYDSLTAGRTDYSDYAEYDYEDDFDAYEQDGVPVIRFSQFAYGTGDRVAQALQDFRQQGYDTVVFDLMDNPGGIISECVTICDALLPETDIFEERYNDRSRYVYVSDPQKLDFNHIIILLNGESASCSEIMALTLKEHLQDKVLLIGSETYGKRVTQSVDDNERMRYSLYLVTAAWSVNGKGTDRLNGYLMPLRGRGLDTFEEGFDAAKAILRQEGASP